MHCGQAQAYDPDIVPLILHTQTICDAMVHTLRGIIQAAQSHTRAVSDPDITQRNVNSFSTIANRAEYACSTASSRSQSFPEGGTASAFVPKRHRRGISCC